MSILVLCIPAVFSILISFGSAIWWKKKTGVALWPFIAGAICFYVFAMILEQLLHSVALTSPTVTGNALVYILYGAFAAGVFEETGRLFGFKVLLRKYTIDDKPCAIAYGIGHGGIEVVLVLGVTYVFYILAELGVTIQDDQTTQMLRAAAESIPFSTTLLAMAERISAMMTHVGLSAIMFVACKEKGRLWLYPVSILIHAAVDMPAVMFQTGILTSLAAVEVLTFIFGATILYLGVRLLYGTAQENTDN